MYATLGKFFKGMVAMIAILGCMEAHGAVYSGIEITDVNVKNQGVTAFVAPGETFGVHAHYKFLFPRENGSIVQIIVGYDGIGAQTTIANALVHKNNYFDHQSLFRNVWNDVTEKEVNFAMVAPEEPGIYEIRFRYAQAYLPDEAVEYWWDVDGAPNTEATIATIIVE